MDNQSSEHDWSVALVNQAHGEIIGGARENIDDELVVGLNLANKTLCGRSDHSYKRGDQRQRRGADGQVSTPRQV
jgi:hypothetical protein